LRAPSSHAKLPGMGAVRTKAAWRAVNRAIPRAIATLLGFLAVIALVKTAVESQWADGWPAALLVFVGAFALWWPAIFIHELGHAIAAHLVGWRVWIFCVGPFVFELHPRLRLSRGALLEHDVGGFVLPAPKTAAQNTQWRDAVISAGGPAASFAAAALVYPYALALDGGAEIEQVLAGALLAFSASSLACAVLTAWPHAGKTGRPNDAASILRKIGARPASPLTHGAALMHYGLDPKHFDPWIGAPVANAIHQQTTLAEQFVEAIAQDDVARAQDLLQGAAGDAVQVMRAYLDACIANDAAGGEAKLAALGAFPAGWIIGARLRQLALVAIIAASGERDDAAKRLTRLAQDISRDSTHPHWNALIDRASAQLQSCA